MKNILIRITLFLTLLSLTSQAVEKAGEIPKPIERIVTDLQGRALEGTILGRKGDDIRIRRKSDGKEFTIKAATMSADDNKYLTSLPEGDYDKPQAGAKDIKIETINTPEKVFLVLPFEKQDRTGICTAGALLNVIKYGDPTFPLTQDELFMLFASGKSGAGYNEMQAALRSLGYTSMHTQLEKEGAELVIDEIRKSLTSNIPVLAATSSHMVTVVGFDSTDPKKKTITVWDQRESKKDATDPNGLGIINMEEKDFGKKYKSIILIKTEAQVANDPDKILQLIRQGLSLDARRYTMTPPVNEPELKPYLQAALVARIAAETRRKNRVIYKGSSDSEFYEVATTPNPAERKPKWEVKSPRDRGEVQPKEETHDEILRRFEANDGVFYVIPAGAVLIK